MPVRSYWLVVAFTTLAMMCYISDGRRLEYAAVFWNYGAHSYEYTYKLDPYYGTGIWRYGLGQLTNKGINESFHLGQFLRQRYHSALSPIFVENELQVKSTDNDMAISSALSVLAGIYPIQNYDMWNSNETTWRPIPIRVSYPNDNEYLTLPRSGSEEYAALKEAIFSSQWMQEYESNHSSFFSKVYARTGENWNIRNIYKLADNIFSLRKHDLPIRIHWYDPDTILPNLKHFNSLYLGSLFTDKQGKYTTAVSKLQGGILLNQIIEAMKSKISQPNKKPLISGYSVPTTTLVGLLVALGNYNWTAPDTASSLMFDLFYDNGTYKMEIRYSNGLDNARLLAVYDCERSCPFDQFVQISANFVGADSANANKSVNTTEDNDSSDDFSTCDGLLLGFIATLFIISFISIGVVLYLLGRPKVPNPSEFESIE